MEVSKCSKIVEFTKISIKMKNCKIFYEAQKTSRRYADFISSDKVLLRLFLRIYTEVKGYLLSKCFKNVVLAVKIRWSENAFSDTKQKHVYCKIFSKFRKLFWLLPEHIIFNVKWVEVHKMSEVFWAKLYCKMSDLFQ